MDGWQIACWNLAKTKEHFEVFGFEKKHHHFFEELKLAYGYELQADDTKIIFVPIEK